MVVNALQELTACLPSMIYSQDLGLQLFWKLPNDAIVVAQNITDSDVLRNIQRAFNNFIESGQIWALLIGLSIGYMLRNLTTYG